MKKKTILFDMDGVLFNTKNNMCHAWNDVNNKFKLKVNFKYYFKEIGIPFDKILKKLNIIGNNKEIELFYRKRSIFYNHLVRIYPNVKLTLKYLLRKNYKIGIVTSKDKFRTLKLLKKFYLKFSTVVSPTTKLRGKPYPDQINKALKNCKIHSSNAVYVGDTNYDFLAAKRANVNFIYASYGYGRLNERKIVKIKKFSDLKKIF
jgi:HAD superfamily hydrolase (TIGR01549 family)